MGTALLVGRSRDRLPVMSLGIFSMVPPTEPWALRSTQPLKVSTRDFSRGKGGRCVWLTIYHPCSAETSRKSGALIYPEPPGPSRLVARHLYFNNARWAKISSLCNNLHSSLTVFPKVGEERHQFRKKSPGGQRIEKLVRSKPNRMNKYPWPLFPNDFTLYVSLLSFG